MHTVTYFGQPGPAMAMQVSHFYCKDAEEQKRLIAYYEIGSPEYKPLVRVLSADSAREEVPFFHHPINAGSAGADRFFKIKWIAVGGKDWTPDGLHVMPQSLNANEWFDIFEKETGWFDAHK